MKYTISLTETSPGSAESAIKIAGYQQIKDIDQYLSAGSDPVVEYPSIGREGWYPISGYGGITYCYDSAELKVMNSAPSFSTPAIMSDSGSSVSNEESYTKAGAWTPSNGVQGTLSGYYYEVNSATAFDYLLDPPDSLFYDANGGQGTMEKTKGRAYETVNVSENQFTRPGYKFLGFSTSPSGPVNVGANYKLTDAKDTVYAIWQGPDISISKSASPTTINTTDESTYTITVSNPVAGTSAKSIHVTDTMPANFFASGFDGTLATSAMTATYDGQATTDFTATLNSNVLNITYNGNLEGGKPLVFTVKGKFGNRNSAKMAGSTFVNTAQVTGTDLEDNALTPKQDDASVTVRKPVITIDKKAAQSKVNLNSVVDYSVTVTQTVDGAIAFDPTISDSLAAAAISGGARIVKSSLKITGPSGDITSQFSGNVNWTEGARVADCPQDATGTGWSMTLSGVNLAKGQNIVVSYKLYTGSRSSTGLIASGIDNTAKAKIANTEDPEKQDSERITVYKPELSIQKDASPAKVNLNQISHFTVVAKQTVATAPRNL